MTSLDHQERLKHHLHTADASKIQELTAELIGRLLHLPIAVANAGFQHGADAGPAGQHGRRFRIECKRYRDSTGLRERELLGEIDQALGRDQAIEAWVLVATCTVSEQIRQSLDQKGETTGVPVVIIDWVDTRIAPLAALCAFAPDLVETKVSEHAAHAARALHEVSVEEVEVLRRNLASWCIGYESVRERSHQQLARIWNSRKEAKAAFGQDVAGGAQRARIRRNRVHHALDEWWYRSPNADSAAAVVGLDGVGKTWATLDWLHDTIDRQPIVLTIPASATDALERESTTRLKQLLADTLHELAGVRDREHWFRRLDRLLRRPIDAGSVLTLYFDGLNQNTAIDWRQRLKIFQSRTFSGRVRIIVSSRNHYFHERLAGLRSLVVPPVRIPVERYDTNAGGELDRLLKFEGLSPADLHPGVAEFARTARLFKPVIHLREHLPDPGQVTVHGVLWEYGRDTFGERADKSFTRDDWLQWLKEIATQSREGVKAFSVQSLSATVNRPDLTANEVYARLSDIIDGRIATPNTAGDLQLNPTVVAHALGIALLSQLAQIGAPTFASLESKLAEWLDPISGFDQQSEILRAALSVLIEQGRAQDSMLAGVLVTSWLQSQNVPDDHLQEIVALAPNLVSALLDAVEHSDAYVHNSARLRAIRALRELTRTNDSALDQIVARTSQWLSIVPRGLDPSRQLDERQERQRANRFLQRIGRDSSGSITVVGIEIELVDHSTSRLPAAVPQLLDGFPLRKALPVIEIAAVSMAITDTNAAWAGFRWLCLLNDQDPGPMTAALRSLANDIRGRSPEPGVLPALADRVAALLLWLTAEEADDDAACSIDPDFYRVWSYDSDYLPHPDTSMFPLERRHAEYALDNTDLRWIYRIQRVGELWLDPQFIPPIDFIVESAREARKIDVTKLTRRSVRTIQDYHFEEVTAPALARCNPRLLASLLQKKMRSMATCPPESRYWSAIHATDQLVLAGETEAAAARSLRLSSREGDGNSEDVAVDELLLLEIHDYAPQRQVVALVEADLNFMSLGFAAVLHRISPDDVDALVTRYDRSSTKQRYDLLLVLSLKPLKLNDLAWNWLYAAPSDSKSRGLMFKMLAQANPTRLGRTLHTDNWSWACDADIWENHYGTGALVEATLDVPFNQLASRMAPWRLIEAARRRGSRDREVRLAATLLGRVLVDGGIHLTDPGCDLSVDISERKHTPFAYSVSPRREKEENEFQSLAIDADAQTQAHQRAFDAAATHIHEARRSGASLYLIDVPARDFETVLMHAPEMIEDWLTGCCTPTDEFRQRVCSAEGAFLGLCETLLAHDPVRGIMLWRTLRSTMMTKFIGECDVDDLLHMVFRVPDSTEIMALRTEFLDLKYCHTDRGLFDLALAASYNGKRDWLADVIDADRTSRIPWRRMRAAILAGFTVNNGLPVAAAWPEGEITTRAGHLDVKSARGTWLEACARHWWGVYLVAADPIEAYAAWVLFLGAADRRAGVWMSEDAKTLDDSQNSVRIKTAHGRLNRSDLSRAQEKRDSKLERVFLDRSIVAGLGPWAEPWADQ